MKNEMMSDKAAGFAGGTILAICAGVVIVFVAGVLFFLFQVISMQPYTNLIEGAETLAVDEVWTVEDKFSVWIDSVTEISVEAAQAYAQNDYLPETLTDTDGKRYYDISFSYHNIDYPGYFEVDEIVEGALCVSTADYGLDAEGKMIPSSVYTVADEGGWWTTAAINGEEVLVTKGITSTDNHLVIEVDETVSELTMLEIVFHVPTTKQATEYSQAYLYPLK